MRGRFISVLFAIIALSLAVSCIQRREVSEPHNGLEKLLSWMTGSFSSQEQAMTDSAFFDIRLEMVPIWPEREDGYWLYVEQAAADNLARPYRQRIYHLSRLDDSTYASSVFEVPAPEQFVGQWRAPDVFSELTLDSLSKREGCTIYLRLEGDSAFVGSTEGASCLSSLRGASYATSEVRITEQYLSSWDRGFDSTGTQVWGAEEGPYLFRKLRNP